MPDRLQPYDDLPLLPPQGIESVAVLRQLTVASRALAAMDSAARALPDPAILIHTIPLQEAQASSAIENIVTTQDALYRAAATDKEPEHPATREALRYRTALRQASEALKEGRYHNGLLVTICATILDRNVTFRGGGEFVHLRGPQGVTYTPPANAVAVPRLLENLESYILEGREDPLLRMAVAHYQFEAIHPFHDGNGRTGRILNAMILQQAGLLEMPILYLSRYIIERKEEYYRLLGEVTFDGAWEPWLLWVLRGVEETSRATLQRIQRITALQQRTSKRIQEEAPDAYRHGIVDIIFRRPYCKIAFLVDEGIAKRQTASKYLQDLERIGILESTKQGREVIYLHPALIEAVQ